MKQRRALLPNNAFRAFWIFGYPLACSIVLWLVDGLQRQNLFVFSLLLLYLIVLFCSLSKSGDAFSPLVWFSAMFGGYVLGGVYFSFDTIHLGKFFELSGISPEKINFYIVIAQIYAIISYVMFASGYLFADKQQEISPLRYEVKRQYGRGTQILGLVFTVFGFVFWLYTTYLLAGGPVDMFLNFSSFKYLLEDNPVSTLPYHFYFVGSYLLFAYFLTRENRQTWGLFFVLLVVFVGFLINLSKGRITASLSYAASFMVMYYFVYHDTIKLKRWFIYLGFVVAVGFLLLMLRVSSAYYFIGKDDPLSALSSTFELFAVFFEVLIGWGNITDIQQLVLIFHAWGIDNPIFGVSYFDWLRNIFISPPTSIGMRVLSLYFPDKVGGPTPGAIGEAFVNFSIFGPVFMFFVGYFFSKIYRFAKKSGDILFLFSYAVFLVNFVFLYAKVDSSLMLGFLWAVLPTLATLKIIRMVRW